MKINGNTILITGGGSGIGRALAEAFHRKGNTVIIAGRRESVLSEVVAANPGMHYLTLDVADSNSIRSFAEDAISRFPDLNVLINNAGIMKAEDITSAPDYLGTAEETVAINLLGPIRLTAALLPHIQKNERSAILTVSSGLAFVPMAMTPTYSATKAAIHSYSMSLRHQLRDTTQVIEIVPPYLQTELMGEHQANDPNAMPLAAFIEEVMHILETEPALSEVVVERCKPLRFAAERGNMEAMFGAINSASH
jgi:uncharacterized oxidoreductase